MSGSDAWICKGCWQQMRMPVPLRGLLATPFRLVGIRRSRMNPNTCTICETMFTRVMKARSVSLDATIMFADLRGYSALSQRLGTEQTTLLLDTFYDICSEAIWRHDGLLNKALGDAVMAVFNFPIRRPDHARAAVEAARDIQRACAERRGDLCAGMGLDLDFGVGIGIDTGATNFGEFGHANRDVTAVGTVVNLASRAQGVAPPGGIMVTDAVRHRVAPLLEGSPGFRHPLKGFEDDVMLYAAEDRSAAG